MHWLDFERCQYIISLAFHSMVSGKVKSIMKKQAMMEKAREQVALKVKRLNKRSNPGD